LVDIGNHDVSETFINKVIVDIKESFKVTDPQTT